MNYLKDLYNKHPLIFILGTGLVFRLIAVLFSQGYAMHDDHFVYLETSFSWTKGLDIGGLIHQSQNTPNASIYNYLYPKFLYVLFSIINTSPKSSMYFIRLIHAFWSLLTVYYGYKIALQLMSRERALQVAWILAILWIFPFLSVRNLVEYICVPFIMLAYYNLIKPKPSFLLVGLFFAMAISLRFQTILIPGGVLVAYLYDKRWREMIYLSISLLVFIILIDGGLGLIYFHQPFGHIINYVKLNVLTPSPHTQGSFFTYFGTLAGFFLILGPFYIWSGFTNFSKKYRPLWAGYLLFFIVHSLISNKQERFMFSIIPLFILLAIGNIEVILQSKYKVLSKIYTYCQKGFWVVNFILLIVFSTYYCKKSRVELMDYFRSKGVGNEVIVMDYYPMKSFIYMPTMYMNYSSKLIYLYNEEYKTQQGNGYITQYDQIALAKNYDFMRLDSFLKKPKYIIFYDKEDFENRYHKALEIFPNLTFETKIESSFLDLLIHIINPVNDEATFWVYNTGI